MKKHFKTILFSTLGFMLFSLAGVLNATPTTLDRVSNFIQPLIPSDYFKVSYLVATSTTATSTFAGGITGPGNFIVQSNSGRVGIGTTVPGAKLEIASTTAGFKKLLTINGASGTDGDGGYIEFAASTVDGYGGQIGGIREGTGGLGSLVFRTGGNSQAERMRITNAGNVGIGTTSPISKLAISGRTSSIDGASVWGGLFGGAGGAQTVVLGNYGGAATIQGANNSAASVISALAINPLGGNVGIATSTPWGTLSITNTTSNPSFIVEDSTSPDTTPFMIDASGNVGVGTTNPSTGKLQIQSSGTNSYPLLITKSDGTTGLIFFKNETDNSGTLQIRGTSSVTNIQLTGNGDSYFNSGNVGIGTTTPNTKLQVNSGSNATNAISWTGSSAGYNGFLGYSSSGATNAWIGNDTNNNSARFDIRMKGNADANTMMTVLGSGNVGIGSTSPYAKLAITNTGTSPSFVVEDSTSPDTTPFIIDASGNVGIGTVSPYAPLTVRSTSAGAYAEGINLDINDTTTSSAIGIDFNTSNADLTATPGARIQGIRIGSNAATDLTFSTRNSLGLTGEIMRITNTGDIGIGTTTPGQRLSVAGDILGNNHIGTYFTATSTSVASQFIYASTTAISGTSLCISTDCRTSWPTGGSGSGTTVFASTTADSASGFFTGANYIGIGSSTPYAKLSVTNTTANPSFIVEDSASPDTTPFIIDSAGQVGIGVTPSAALTVNNAIKFSGTGSGNAGNISWGTGYGNAALTLYDGGAGSRYGWGLNSSEMQFFIPSSGFRYTWNKGGDFQSTGTNEIMRLLDTGKLGIGTTTPGQSISTFGDILGNNLIASYFTATSTTATSTFKGNVDISQGTIKQHVYPSFNYASSTFTGTTTIQLGPAFTQETWNSIMCFTDVGTATVALDDGTNVMNNLQASTTVGTVTLSTNNTFVVAEKRFVKIGSPLSSVSKVSCTADKTINP